MNKLNPMPTPEEKREKQQATSRAWKAQNKEKIRALYLSEPAKETQRKWRAAHPEKVREYYRRYRERRTESVIEASRKYWNSERGRNVHEKHRRKIWSDPSLRMTRIVKAAFVRAIRNDIAFDQCLLEILPANPPMICACCGVGFNYNEDPSRTRQRTSPSIDRVDNEKGYVVGNVQIICWGCNEDKSHLTVERMEQFIAYIKSHVGKMPCEVAVS